MPLSTAHPAIVFPLCRLSKNQISSTTLIIGSISPDLEYFFHLLPKRTFGHDVFHACWFDLIITITVSFIFHNIVRNTLIDNSPHFISQRFQRFKNLDWNQHFSNYFIVIIISALIGIYSHILWDEFTHKGSYIADSVPAFNYFLMSLFGYKIYVYNLLQQVSSFIGTLIVIVVLFSFKRDSIFQNSGWYKYWLFIGLFSILLFSLKIWTVLDVIQLNLHYIVMLGLTLISSFFIGLVLTSFLYSFFKQKC